MKKTIVCFLLALGALSLRAEESYIYWLQTSATFDGTLPGSEPYNAKIVAINGTEWSYGGGEYLNLWTVADGGIGPGESIGKVTEGVYLSAAGSLNNMPRYANITGATGTSGWTYFIELYNGNELFARSSEGLAYDDASAYIYTAGAEIIKPTSGFSAMTFIPAAVPEPTSGLLMLIGSALLALRRKRHDALVVDATSRRV